MLREKVQYFKFDNYQKILNYLKKKQEIFFSQFNEKLNNSQFKAMFASDLLGHNCNKQIQRIYVPRLNCLVTQIYLTIMYIQITCIYFMSQCQTLI